MTTEPPSLKDNGSSAQRGAAEYANRNVVKCEPPSGHKAEWQKRAEMLKNIHDKGDDLWNEITAALDYAYRDGLKGRGLCAPLGMEELAKWFAEYFDDDDMLLARLRADSLLANFTVTKKP